MTKKHIFADGIRRKQTKIQSKEEKSIEISLRHLLLKANEI